MLTNAVADQIVDRDVPDRSIVITASHVEAAKETIEVKIRRDVETETESESLDQVARYLGHAGLGEGWLVMFDLRKNLAWADKQFVREVEHARCKTRIVGC